MPGTNPPPQLAHGDSIPETRLQDPKKPQRYSRVKAPRASQPLDASGRRWDGSWPMMGGRLGILPETRLVAQDCSIPCEITRHFLSPLPPSGKPRLGCVWESSTFCGEAGVRKDAFFQAGRDRKVSLFAKFLPSHLLFPINGEKKPSGPGPRSSHCNSHRHLSTSQ